MPVSEAFPLTGEGRLPLSGGDVERSETEGVGRHGEAVTDEGEKNRKAFPHFPAAVGRYCSVAFCTAS